MIRSSSAATSISPNISSTNSSENVVPPCTCNWTRRFIDKFGIRYECKTPTNIVTEHISAVSYNLFPEEVNNLEKLSDILGCLYNFNHGSLFDINHRGLNFFTPNEEQLREEVTIKEIDLSKYSTFVKKFGVSLWFLLKEKQTVIPEAKYCCLFEQFLEMFGLDVMAKPVIESESTEILRQKVSARADIVCISPRDVEKCILAVCGVTDGCRVCEADTEPTAAKLRRTGDAPGREDLRLPDGLPAQHVGDLLTYLDKSICKEAILGMTVEKTAVTFTRLFVLEETLKKIQSSLSYGSVKLKEEERPVLYYSRPYNYLLQDDRKEIVKALLTLTVMEKRRAKKS